MPLFFKLLSVFISVSIVGIVARVLAALGLAVVAYQGIDLVMDEAVQWVSSSWGGISSDVAGVLSMAGFDTAITIILSAHVSVISMKLVGGALKRIAFKAVTN